MVVFEPVLNSVVLEAGGVCPGRVGPCPETHSFGGAGGVQSCLLTHPRGPFTPAVPEVSPFMAFPGCTA